MTSIGQGEPAMMPVRSVDRSNSLEARMVELGDEHGRHAVQAGAALLLHGLQHGYRLEAFAGIDHGGAVGDAGQVAQHHAEAVVERHRDAQAVVLGQAASPRR